MTLYTIVGTDFIHAILCEKLSFSQTTVIVVGGEENGRIYFVSNLMWIDA